MESPDTQTTGREDSAPPETSASVPPPGAEELAAAGVPAGGLTGQTPRRDDDIPQDADDNRGKHFRALLGNKWVLGITWTVAIIALIVGTTQAGIGIGAAAVGVVLLIALIVVFAIANHRAAEDFFNAYAEGRGLTRVGARSSLPPVTPLLRKGDRRYAEETFTGTLPGGLAGTLALYTYEEKTRDSDGDEHTTYYKFTVVLTQLPETATFIGELEVQRRFGFRFLDGFEDFFRTRQRVELESEAADKRFEIFIGKNDDMNRARQIFSPSFIVWLAEEAHEKIAFELVGGALVVNVPGHKKSARELDEFCEAAAVIARRLHDEATE
ncbi:MAG TPA: hypothetical protein VIL04_05975 [Solirubrobacterales bacterium]